MNDVAIVFERHIMKPCNINLVTVSLPFLQGLAVMGGMCRYRTVANVNGYQGLQTAKTLAHETGHK